MLTMSWTVVHPIDDHSPFYQKSGEDLAAAEVEILILIKAFDDTFSQTVHTRTSYRDEDIIHNAKFTDLFSRDKDGQLMIDLSKIGDTKPA